MATIININGYRFAIESDGWRGHEQPRDEAIDGLETALKRMPVEKIAALHAALAAGNHPDEAEQLCYQAVRSVVSRWHDPSAPALMMGAA